MGLACQNLVISGGHPLLHRPGVPEDVIFNRVLRASGYTEEIVPISLTSPPVLARECIMIAVKCFELTTEKLAGWSSSQFPRRGILLDCGSKPCDLNMVAIGSLAQLRLPARAVGVQNEVAILMVLGVAPIEVVRLVRD